MAISVDTVYQKVLAFANKEQRGYITPQEFNLFANQAQMEILDQYFYDINQFSRLPGNDTEYSDMLRLLDEKLSVLKKTSTKTITSGKINLSDMGGTGHDVYKLGSIFHNGNTEIEEVNYNESKLLRLSKLTAPTLKRPVYTNQNGWINIYPNNITSIYVSYIKKPDAVKWGYIVVSDKALYDPARSTNFELHSSEEPELVYRILAFAGIAIEKPQLVQAAVGLEQAKVQQEKQ